MNWTIVKVGGSLYDWPELSERLAARLAQIDTDRVLIVPGGGATADAIRALDQVHRLGEEASHWLAIQSLSLNARFLRHLLPMCGMLSNLDDIREARNRLNLLDALPFFEEDESRPDHLPHEWSVTSDSLALRVATLLNASDLILLKSTGRDDGDWAALEIVDPFFSEAMKSAPETLRTRIVNLRAWPPDDKRESASATR